MQYHRFPHWSIRRLSVTLTWMAVIVFSCLAPAVAEDRPNILWITCEDISSHIGCFGDDYAVTPNIDGLAKQSVRYTHAFAPIGVCAPARSCLITGMYPPSIGSQHMRCQGTIPAWMHGYPEYLRDAGYYCTNNSKQDYNLAVRKSTWDESSNKAHWRDRADNQPFFSIFNLTSCHESQIRLPEKAYQARTAKFTDKERHEPAGAEVPPYHPDHPEVRRDWARYADMITYMDKQAGEILKQLEDDGLAEDTIVFFYSDHGAGMPRSKRWLYDSSTRVPMTIRFPKRFAHLQPSEPGTTTDRLVSFVDFGPTALSLAGVPVPEHMQGKPFLGTQEEPARKYVYGFRDRMDERYDLIRSVRDHRYKYIRNYMPQMPWFHHQYIGYMFQMPTMRVWQQMADAGELSGPTAVFMQLQKPTEELYDTENDPHEVNNLAASPEHQQILKKLREECQSWMLDIVDLGLLPEAELRSRFAVPPYLAVRENPDSYPMKRIMAAADLANARDAKNTARLVELLADQDATVRYWGATGLGLVGPLDDATLKALTAAQADKNSIVQVAAADALCRLEEFSLAVPVLKAAMSDQNDWVRLYAINVLDRIDEQAAPAAEELKAARKDTQGYVQRVADHAVEGLAN